MRGTPHGPSHPYEALALRLHDLPGKIELKAYGAIEMSPASTRRAPFQAAVAQALAAQLPAGTALTECSIATHEGVREPDVAWASADFVARHGDMTPLPQAPEICVEVLSPCNTEAEMLMKTWAYLEAGAHEGWLVADSGVLQVCTALGQQPGRRYGVNLALN